MRGITSCPVCTSSSTRTATVYPGRFTPDPEIARKLMGGDSRRSLEERLFRNELEGMPRKFLLEKAC